MYVLALHPACTVLYLKLLALTFCSRYLFYVTMAFLASGDTALNTQIMCTLGLLQKSKTEVVFGWKQVICASAAALNFFTVPYFSFQTVQILYAMSLTIGAICFYLNDRFVFMIDRPKEKKPREAMPLKVLLLLFFFS